MSRSDSLAEAARPLIADSPPSSSTTPDDNLPRTPTSLFNASRLIYFLTLSAGLSGLLFGYDTGVISATLVSIGSDLSSRPLTTADKSLITAITSLLALLSAPTTGFFADRYGRKSVIAVPALLFVLGAVLQAVSAEVSIMVLGRALVGAAVGVASGASPLYIAELAPAELRGRLVTLQSLFVTGGQVVAYLIGFAFADVEHGWRWMVGLGAVPAGVQLILLLWMPETPRWLLKQDRNEEAQEVLARVYASLPEEQRAKTVQRVMESIRAEIVTEDGRPSTASAMSALFRVPGHRRALTIACLLQGLQQLSGFNCLMYFSATTFQLVGFRDPIFTSLSIALTNFAFTLLALRLIDGLGRRRILLWSVGLMVLGLLGCSLAFVFLPLSLSPSSIILTTNTPSDLEPWPAFLLASMIFYVAAYATGLGCVPWQQAELFPLSVRSVGAGLATATNWAGNALVGVSFLPLMTLIGARWTFALYALLCAAGGARIYAIYPETAGLEVEEIGALLRDGFGVRSSVRAFEERRAAAAAASSRKSVARGGEDEDG